jgi:hypothetical protein
LRQDRHAAKAYQDIACIWPGVEDERAILVAARLIKIGSLRAARRNEPGKGGCADVTRPLSLQLCWSD